MTDRLVHPSSRNKVLFISDFDDGNEPINMLLRLYLYRTVWMHDSQGGLNQALLSSPDFILSDLAITDGGAFEVVQQLRSTGEFNEIPMVALCSDTREGFHDTVIERGFSRYFCKPLKFEQLDRYFKSFV